MDLLILGVILLAVALLAARVLLVWWQARGAAGAAPWDRAALEKARREARELQVATKAEPSRQLEAAKALGRYKSPRP